MTSYDWPEFNRLITELMTLPTTSYSRVYDEVISAGWTSLYRVGFEELNVLAAVGPLNQSNSTFPLLADNSQGGFIVTIGVQGHIHADSNAQGYDFDTEKLYFGWCESPI